jgi:hypothetical protein
MSATSSTYTGSFGMALSVHTCYQAQYACLHHFQERERTEEIPTSTPERDGAESPPAGAAHTPQPGVGVLVVAPRLRQALAAHKLPSATRQCEVVLQLVTAGPRVGRAIGPGYFVEENVDRVSQHIDSNCVVLAWRVRHVGAAVRRGPSCVSLLQSRDS